MKIISNYKISKNKQKNEIWAIDTEIEAEVESESEKEKEIDTENVNDKDLEVQEIANTQVEINTDMEIKILHIRNKLDNKRLRK